MPGAYIDKLNKESEDKTMASKRLGFVTGVVGFYGKVDNYNGDGKEYCLRIENPVFTDLDQEAINEVCTITRGKNKGKLLNFYQDLKDGKEIEAAYFHSSYPINKVYIVEGEELTQYEVKNPELEGHKVKMMLNKTYIGSIVCDDLPSEYTGKPFNMEDFGGSIDFGEFEDLA